MKVSLNKSDLSIGYFHVCWYNLWDKKCGLEISWYGGKTQKLLFKRGF